MINGITTKNHLSNSLTEYFFFLEHSITGIKPAIQWIIQWYNGKWSKAGKGNFSYNFSIYIDPLLLQLRNSGYGCHLNGVYYMGALSYAR